MKMNKILRRIEKLETRLLPGWESEEVQQLWARIQAARRRVSEARARGELPPEPTGPQVEATRLHLMRALKLIPY